MNVAEQALQLPNCQALFQSAGVNGLQVFRELRAAGNIRLADETLMIPGPRGPVRFIDTDLSGVFVHRIIYINPNDPAVNGEVASPLMGRANPVQIVAGVMIHEELHKVGVFPADIHYFNLPGIGEGTHNMESLTHTLKVMSVCIHPLRSKR